MSWRPSRFRKEPCDAYSFRHAAAAAAAAVVVIPTAVAAPPTAPPLGQPSIPVVTVGTGATGGSVIASNGAAIGAAPASALPYSTSNGLCSGWWYWPTGNVYFWTASGRLNWDFYLPAAAQGELGPFVTVSMPYALVNGHAINPPYAPHYEPSGYDFHSSMLTYQYIPGPGGGTIKSGDTITLYWFITGSSGTNADRYITCTMP